MGDNGSCANKGAQDLLVEFQQSGSQEPFEEIARRYAGMVYNVALRVTRDAHDAEDATQATFLTLAVHAKTAGKIRYLGPWLKKVSHRLALDIRRSKKRRRAREERHANGNGSSNGDTVPVSNGLHIEELRTILRDEIDKLPAKYRLPLILYYFGGLSPEQMSKELCCNTSTLGVRLHRGRKLLAETLSRRGVTLSSVMIGAILSGLIDSFVRDNLVLAASQAAAHAAIGGLAAQSPITGNVLALIHSITAGLRLGRLKTAVAVAALLATTLAGATEILRRYDLLDSGLLNRLNLMQYVRPLLDRMLQPPRLRSELDHPPINGELNALVLVPQTGVDSGLTLSMRWTQGGGLPDAVHLIGPMGSVWSSRAVMAEQSPAMGGGVSIMAPLPRMAIAPSSLPMDVWVSSGTAPAAMGGQQSVRSTAVARSGAAALNVDRTNPANSGQYVFTDTSATIGRVIVGDSTSGRFIQQFGSLNVTDQLVLGHQRQSDGVYELGGTAYLTAPSVIVGNEGHGTFVQNGGTATFTGLESPANLVIASAADSSGEYHLNGGTLLVDSTIIGSGGKGTFRQTGGTALVSIAELGAKATGSGTISLLDGTFKLVAPTDPRVLDAFAGASQSPFAPPSPLIVVGAAGEGSVVLTNNIREGSSARGSVLVVRSNKGGTGTVVGYGKVELSGALVQNGKVIADGLGAARSLDLSAAARVTNTIDNPPVGGDAGWYARDGGSLHLPAIAVSGQHFYTWGEEPFDDVIDLVNSVRFRPRVNNARGLIDLVLRDPRASNLPALPGDATALSVWSLDSTVDLDGIDLIIRYDDALAGRLKLSEADLGLWVYQDAGWQLIDDGSFGIDPNLNLIWGSAGDPVYIATARTGAITPSFNLVAIPEPATLALLAAGAAGLLLGRRRSRPE